MRDAAVGRVDGEAARLVEALARDVLLPGAVVRGPDERGAAHLLLSVSPGFGPVPAPGQHGYGGHGGADKGLGTGLCGEGGANCRGGGAWHECLRKRGAMSGSTRSAMSSEKEGVSPVCTMCS